MSESSFADQVDRLVRRRKTEKVMCELEDRTPVPEAVASKNNERVMRALETAGWAPFHFPRKVDRLAEPWRAHVLWHESAHKLAFYLRDELEVKSKLPLLAAASSALVLVTWLPEFYDEAQREGSRLPRETQIVRDEEHLAAASAMVQSFLLLLTAHDMGTYWSSGGILCERETLEHLGVPAGEQLLAAVFIEYPEMHDDSRVRKPGSQRNRRSEDWIRPVTL
ncbi:MAG: nitroreductase family protein [Acidobacteriota bacterium]